MNTKEQKEILKIFKILLSTDKNSIYFKTNLYKTSGKEAFNFDYDKADLSYEFAEQVKQILKAENLISRLTKISENVSYLTSCAIEKYINYLEMGLMVYDQGKDTPKFDKMFSDLNNYVETGIVKLKLKNPILNAIGLKHTSFREKYNTSESSINNPEDCYAFSKETTNIIDGKTKK